MRAMEHVYHLHCFVCICCGQRLMKGDQFVLKGGQLFCRQDYDNEMQQLVQQQQLAQPPLAPPPARTTHQQQLHENQQKQKQSQLPPTSPKSSVTSSEDYSPVADELDNLSLQGSGLIDPDTGSKRPRTILNPSQRKVLKASFDVSAKPSRKVREALAAETSLSVRVVQVWFQNQRAKIKKIERRQLEHGDAKPGERRRKRHKPPPDDTENLVDGECKGKLSCPSLPPEGYQPLDSDSGSTTSAHPGPYALPAPGSTAPAPSTPPACLHSQLPPHSLPSLHSPYFLSPNPMALPPPEFDGVPEGVYPDDSGSAAAAAAAAAAAVSASLLPYQSMAPPPVVSFFGGDDVSMMTSSYTSISSLPPPAPRPGGQEPVNNPIDRLYSMHTNYFTGS